MHILKKQQKEYNDLEVIEGLQAKNPKVESWFYDKAKKHFELHFTEDFFDPDHRQEIFQESFLILWSEITNKKISIDNGAIARIQANKSYKPMTCNLYTFLMAIAKNEYREMVRDHRETCYAEFFDNAENADTDLLDKTSGGTIEEQKIRIVDECIKNINPHCREILTMFYYEGKSLEEILASRNDKNQSKGGLKTAKYKCMNTLRENIKQQFIKYGIRL